MHSDLFVRFADELMLLQTRSSNRVSVTLRAFQTLIITEYPLPRVVHAMIKSDEFGYILFLDIPSLISIARPLSF